MSHDNEHDLAERIRVRAYHLWEQQGRPEGRADAHWDQATELVAIEDNQRLAMKPVPTPEQLGPTGEPVEPLQAVENAGEFPTLTDQGEERTAPTRRASPANNTGARTGSAPTGKKAAPEVKAALNGTHSAGKKRGKESGARAS